LASLPAFWLLPSLLGSSCSSDLRDRAAEKSVLVIGAGISGLAAARELRDIGFNVKVLEGRDRVGGRLRANRELGVAFDEGASWIHGVRRNPITELAAQAGMNSFYTNDESIASYDLGGVKRSTADYLQAEEAFYEVFESLHEQGSPDKSFAQLFAERYPQYANNRLWKFFLSTYIAFDTGDLDLLSSKLYYEGEEFGGDEEIATNGYDTIAKHLAEGLDVLLEQRVTKIDYSQIPVVVTHNGVESPSDFVVLTVPLGVLKSGDISFEPALPDWKRTAIEKIGMNCVNKFLLVWDEAFWDDVQYISYTPEEPDQYNYFVNVKKFHPTVNALMTFAYAERARETENQTDAQVLADIMAHLRDMFGPTTPEPSRMLRTRWLSDPFSYGGYSFTAVGSSMSQFDDLARSLDDRLFFAGEHTHREYFSTAHGAYLSGAREAEKIIQQIE